jgi:hypothetical protein
MNVDLAGTWRLESAHRDKWTTNYLQDAWVEMWLGDDDRQPIRETEEEMRTIARQLGNHSRDFL